MNLHPVVMQGHPRSRLWYCSRCGRAEYTALRKPKCEGTPYGTHPRHPAEPLSEQAGIRPRDSHRYFV